MADQPDPLVTALLKVLEGSMVFVFVGVDRHTDDEIRVHASLAGAMESVAEFKARYANHYKWEVEHIAIWPHSERTDDDGPKVRVEGLRIHK